MGVNTNYYSRERRRWLPRESRWVVTQALGEQQGWQAGSPTSAPPSLKQRVIGAFLCYWNFDNVLLCLKCTSGGNSDQDEGIEIHLPPRTTKRRTTNLKAKNNHNCQKIKLYGSLTAKDLKKKHSSIPVGGTETGSWEGEDAGQGGSLRTG